MNAELLLQEACHTYLHHNTKRNGQ